VGNGAIVSLVVLGLVVVLFVTNWLPVEVVAIGSALVLWAAGVIDLDQAVAGFVDPTVILIAALFVVSEGLDATGVTTWVGRQLGARAGGSRTALLAMIMLLFAGSAGLLLLLTGSPVNVILSEAAAEASGAPFGFAEFALVGVPLVAGTVLVVLLVGDRLLPNRVGAAVPRDLSGLAHALVRQYRLGNVGYLAVPAGSSLVGHPRGVWDLSDYPDVNIVTVTDAAADRPVSEGELAVGDRVTVGGAPDGVTRFGARPRAGTAGGARPRRGGARPDRTGHGRGRGGRAAAVAVGRRGQRTRTGGAGRPARRPRCAAAGAQPGPDGAAGGRPVVAGGPVGGARRPGRPRRRARGRLPAARAQAERAARGRDRTGAVGVAPVRWSP
jgi:hypothetical protein